MIAVCILGTAIELASTLRLWFWWWCKQRRTVAKYPRRWQVLLSVKAYRVLGHNIVRNSSYIRYNTNKFGKNYGANLVLPKPLEVKVCGRIFR
jgi:hypothetical protein